MAQLYMGCLGLLQSDEGTLCLIWALDPPSFQDVLSLVKTRFGGG